MLLFCFAVLCALPFLRAWDYGLVNLDDYNYLISHPQLWEGPFLASAWHFLTTLREAIWMPLTWASYALDYAVFGDWYGGFHLHSIVVHAINAGLVWLLLRKLFVREENRQVSILVDLACITGAVVWAIHPLRCESVVLLSSRKDVLSFCWELLALLCWVDGSAGGDRDRQTRCSTRAMVFFVIGALCKPSVMTFPVLCLFIDFFVFRRVDVRRYVTPVVFALCLAVSASWQQRAGGALGDFAGETLLMRLADCAAAFGVYLKNTVWPAHLAVQCVKRWPELPQFLMPGIVLSLAYGTFLAVRMVSFVRCAEIRFPSERRDCLQAEVLNRRKGGEILLGLLWFGVAIAPMLGLVPFGVHAFADRFTYIPAVGLSIAVVAVLLRLVERIRPSFVYIPCCALVLALGVRTWHQTGYWRDDGTAFSHTLEVDGERNPVAHRALSAWHFDVTHDLDACIRHYESVLRFGRQCVDGTYILYMLALCERGEYAKMPEALENCKLCLTHGENREIDPKALKRIYTIGKLAWIIGDPTSFDVAEKMFEENKDLDDPVWLYLRWQFALKRGDTKEATRQLEKIHAIHRPNTYLQLRYLRRGSKGSVPLDKVD